jgi:hypothetical protein
MLDDASTCNDKCDTGKEDAIATCLSALVRDGYTPDQVQEILRGCESNASAGHDKCKAACQAASKIPETPPGGAVIAATDSAATKIPVDTGATTIKPAADTATADAGKHSQLPQLSRWQVTDRKEVQDGDCAWEAELCLLSWCSALWPAIG